MARRSLRIPRPAPADALADLRIHQHGAYRQLFERRLRRVVSNVNFTPTYLRDDREFELLAKVYDYANGPGMTTWIYDEYHY